MWQPTLVKVVDSNGDLLPIVGGNLPVVSQPYLYAVAEGDITGHTLMDKIGFNAAVGTSEVEVWSKGNTAYVYPAATGIQMAVVSSNNTNDKAEGTGALTVTIGYLDANYASQTTTVTLNGTTPVNTTPTNIRRVNSFRVATTGSTGKAAGNISLTNVAGTVTYSYITAGFTRARSSMYTVPAGKTFYMTSMSASAAGLKYMRVILKASLNLGTVFTSGIQFYPFYEVILLNNVSDKHFDAPLVFPATTDIKVSAIAEASGSLVVCDYRGWVE